MEATARLMFWLKVPYAADVVLALIGIALLASGREVGWWVLVFAAVRAVVGTVALFWIAPRMLAKRAADSGQTVGENAASQPPSDGAAGA